MEAVGPDRSPATTARGSPAAAPLPRRWRWRPRGCERTAGRPIESPVRITLQSAVSQLAFTSSERPEYDTSERRQRNTAEPRPEEPRAIVTPHDVQELAVDIDRGQ